MPEACARTLLAQSLAPMHSGGIMPAPVRHRPPGVEAGAPSLTAAFFWRWGKTPLLFFLSSLTSSFRPARAATLRAGARPDPEDRLAGTTPALAERRRRMGGGGVGEGDGG